MFFFRLHFFVEWELATLDVAIPMNFGEIPSAVSKDVV